jgi:hypothetical protein
LPKLSSDLLILKRLQSHAQCSTRQSVPEYSRGNVPDLNTAGQIRREYHRQRHLEKMRLIHRIQQQIAL